MVRPKVFCLHIWCHRYSGSFNSYRGIPMFGIRTWAALSCVGGKNAGSYRFYLGCSAGPHTKCSMFIDSYQFLSVISSVMITCTYHFTVDDNHLQKSTILSSAICCFTILSSHYINLSLINCVRKFDREIIWNFCVLRLLYYTSAIIHFASFDVQRRLPKFYSIHNKGQS